MNEVLMSHPPRFFITPDQIAGRSIVITGDDLRHIRTVLRKEPGDLLTLLDGRGMEYSARIVESRGDGIVCEMVAQSKHEIAGPRIILGQGIAKSDKMDWIVQKATELGVASIVPLTTERTIVKVRDEEKRVMRWQKIAREAAMQSRRLDIPAVGPVMPYDRFLTTLFPGPRTLFLIPWEEGTRPLKDALRSYPDATDITVLIGPEGGFSLSEAKAAQDKGFHAVSLGPTILRTETAAIAVLSMLGYEYA
jgi:16S rRNA (uracil1498-N3)-methyltransferase